MKNNYNFTKKVLVTILRNHQQSEKTFTVYYTEWYSVFHLVEDRFKYIYINPSFVVGL